MLSPRRLLLVLPLLPLGFLLGCSPKPEPAKDGIVPAAGANGAKLISKKLDNPRKRSQAMPEDGPPPPPLPGGGTPPR